MSVVAGLQVIAIAPSKCRPNRWNPNRMDAATFEKEKASITEHGFVDPITVRSLPDSEEKEVVDGEHRCRAAVELGLKEIPVIDLGIISEDRAKKLTIIFNDLRGAPEPVLLGKLLAELAEVTPIEQLSAELPYSTVEIESMVSAVTKFDWDEPGLPSSQPRTEDSTPGGGPPGDVVVEAKVAFGSVRGSVPMVLAQALVAEYNRTSVVLGSKSMDGVLRDWVERLKATPPVAPTAPPVVAVDVPTRPSKPKTAKKKPGVAT